MKAVSKPTAPKSTAVESITIKLDAKTVHRLRFCANEEGMGVESFAAAAVVQSLVASMEALDMRGEEKAVESAAIKLNA